MRTRCLQLVVALVVFALPGMASAEKAPAAGERLVGIRLDAPETTDTRAYLGLTEDFVVHKSVGTARTPFFIIIDIGPNDKGRVLWTGAGPMNIETAPRFLSYETTMYRENMKP